MGKLKESFLDFRDDTLDFVDNHRVGLIIVSIIAVMLLSYLVFRMLTYSTTSILISSADESVGEIIATNARYVDYKATARNSKTGDSLPNVEWSADAGRIEQNEDGTIRWYLPSESGTYTITAKNDEGDSGFKRVTIIGSELAKLYANSVYNITLNDKDGDGLTDIYEASYSKTSDDNKDTDNDGLYDGDEIILGYDPLKSDSKGDGIKDGERESDYTFTNDNVTIKMHGTGNFTQTTVDKYETETLENVPSVLDELYAFYTEAKLTTGVEITIKYDKSLVSEKKLDETSLAVYSLDDQNNKFAKVSTSRVNTDNSTLTFSVEEFGKYFIADSSKLTSNLATELVFLIDNSASMYSKDEVPESEENDVDFNRVTVSNNLISKLKGNYKFGAGKFTGKYTELASLTDDKTRVMNRISSIKTEPETAFSGTYVGAALEGALKQFSDVTDNNRRYIILLSDGADTTNIAGYDKKLLEEQIKVAADKKVKVYTVGLGNVIDEENLTAISEGTKGKYYFAATADDLNQIFDLIAADLNYNLYDTDNDTVDDSVILADSGFYVKRDGFSFSNFSNSQDQFGYGYGMALYAKLFFQDEVPESLSSKKITNNTGKVVEAPASEAKDLMDATPSSLRTYIPETEGLTILSDLPDNFWGSEISSGLLPINLRYSTMLSSIGFKIMQTAYSDGVAKFNRYETIQFDVTPYMGAEVPKESPLGEIDSELIRTLARFDITKYRDEKYQFYDGNDNTFKTLTEELKEGRPVMLRLNDDYTVLATKLLMDTNNMNKYKIEVYDPNYSGAMKYIEVERTKFSDIKENSKEITDRYEYRFKYQGTNVGICLSIVHIVDEL